MLISNFYRLRGPTLGAMLKQDLHVDYPYPPIVTFVYRKLNFAIEN